MQTKTLPIAIIFLFFTITAIAQTGSQPFADLGKKVKTLTLTNGKYEEFFDDDSIQQIGSALINIHTMELVKLKLTPQEQKIIDNTSGARFLSVDPIANSYPMLTPYQYASNRPIDGIDLDGLEYLTYTINIDLGKRTNGDVGAVTNANYVWYNANQHNAHGALGQGVQYIVNYTSGNTVAGQDVFFIARNATKLGFKTEYGNYMGATSLFKIESDGHGFTKKYDYDLPAVDHVDFLAMNHDKGYDALHAIGQNSLFNDWGTTPVDEAALNGWNNFLSDYKTGSKDPYNLQSVTSGERGAAGRAAFLFNDVVSNKKIQISSWMSDNYMGEAKFSVKPGMEGVPDNKVVEFNYKLFLQKYMSQDKSGNWTRKDGMWAQDEKGNWTPNKPTK